MRGIRDFPHPQLSSNARGARAPQPHAPAAPREAFPGRIAPGIGAAEWPRVLAPQGAARTYRVRKRCAGGEFASIGAALAQWRADQHDGQPHAALIEIGDSATYDEAPHIVLAAGEQLELRAANMAHPVLHTVERASGMLRQVRIAGAPGSALTLDGITVTGGALEIEAGAHAPQPDPAGAMRVTLRHCTLAPPPQFSVDGAAPWRARAGIIVRARELNLRIERCIVGPLRAARRGGLIALDISDSIVDAGHEAGLALADEAYGSALARASIVRSVVIGVVQLEQLALAEDAVFLGPLLAVRRDTGRVSACYVAPGSRTPPRVSCQPDMALQWEGASLAREGERVRPRYVSLRHGTPGYCQLAAGFAEDDAVALPAPGRHVDAPSMRFGPN